MTEAERLFWPTAAQLAAVFGLALVLEVRQSLTRLVRASRRQRLIEVIVFWVTGIVIVGVLLASIGALAWGESTSWSLSVAAWGLALATVTLVSTPLAMLVAASAFDLWAEIAEAMPWSHFSRYRRALPRYQAQFSEIGEQYTEQLDELERRIKRGKSMRTEFDEMDALNRHATEVHGADENKGAAVAAEIARARAENEEVLIEMKQRRREMRKSFRELVDLIEHLERQPERLSAKSREENVARVKAQMTAFAAMTWKEPTSPPTGEAPPTP